MAGGKGVWVAEISSGFEAATRYVRRIRPATRPFKMSS